MFLSFFAFFGVAQFLHLWLAHEDVISCGMVNEHNFILVEANRGLSPVIVNFFSVLFFSVFFFKFLENCLRFWQYLLLNKNKTRSNVQNGLVVSAY